MIGGRLRRLGRYPELMFARSSNSNPQTRRSESAQCATGCVHVGARDRLTGQSALQSTAAGEASKLLELGRRFVRLCRSVIVEESPDSLSALVLCRASPSQIFLAPQALFVRDCQDRQWIDPVPERKR